MIRRWRRGTALAAGLTVVGAMLGSPAADARTPGAPVAPLAQVNQSSNGGDNTSLGLVPATSRLGTPNAGVVPLVGSASAKADDGAYVAYESRLSSRVVDLMISSPALAGAVPVRVFLPPTWSSSPTATYPVLMLLPGASEKADYQSWSLYTTVSQVTASTRALVVMPSLGSTGIGSNWTGAAKGYQYETFLSAELPQLLSRGYRATNRTVVAGISTGGYTAVQLAADHPGTYSEALSYSGLLHPSDPVSEQVIQGLLVREGLPPNSLWGSPLLNLSTWWDRDPSMNAARLRSTPVYVSSGNGLPGPFDAPGLPSLPLETVVLQNSQFFAFQARFAGVSMTSDFYGAGTHSWPYWNREFSRTWPGIRSALGV